MSRTHPSPFLVTSLLAVASALYLTDGPPPGFAMPVASQAPTAPTDPEAAVFDRCKGTVRSTCVVDGDTIWYLGTKIRVAGINAPEVGEPHCSSEAALGERAAKRLTQLLNAGSFSLEAIDRERDRYGRQLRTLTRGGRSLGAQLVREGLAEPWRGYRRDWCRSA